VLQTNLTYELPNASQALRFEMTDFAAYDVYMLQRENAADDYEREVLSRAEQRFIAMSSEERELLEKNIIAGAQRVCATIFSRSCKK
jgi:mannonate dehydratase